MCYQPLSKTKASTENMIYLSLCIGDCVQAASDWDKKHNYVVNSYGKISILKTSFFCVSTIW